MLKALLAKQFLEFGEMYLRDRKTGKRRTPLGVAGYILLFAFVFVSMAFAFGMIAFAFAEAFLPLGYDWLYFSMLGMTAILGSTLLSMFLASSEIFRAKDNELLLSMPIPASKILFVRMTAVYAWCLFYEILVFLPASVVYWIFQGSALSAGQVILPLAVLLLTSLFALALSCAGGWIVAAISARLRNRSLVTVVLTLAVIGLYYFFCFRVNTLLSEAAAHVDELGDFIRGVLVPVYHIGMAASGDAASLLPVAALSVAAFAVAYAVLSRTFLRITTTNRGEKKTVYREQTAKQINIPAALRGKELLRFSKSAVYLLNAGLGLIILPIIGIVLLVKADQLRQLVGILTELLPEARALIPAAVGAIGCFALSTVEFTAPSISLEGKTLWLLQSMPVHPYAVLREKVRTQLLLTALPGLFLVGCACYVLELTLTECIAILVLLTGYSYLSAIGGLCLDLRHPILSWTNETVPVKQNFSALIGIFGGWVLAAAFGAGAWFTRNLFEPKFFIILCGTLLLVFCRMIDRWLRTKGAELFSSL